MRPGEYNVAAGQKELFCRFHPALQNAINNIGMYRGSGERNR